MVMAQTERYWAVGTAVPGGKQELAAFPGKQFKYTGRLIEGGTLRFRNKEEHSGLSVRYLKPTCEDAYAVTNATPFTLVRDSTASLWTVPLTEDVYRITIDLNKGTLTGELFRPWNELFIVGGATECGWVTYTFLPFTRDDDELCTWDWTGELKERQEFGEPRRFKFEGQNAWEPKVLHPFSQDEDILSSTQIRTGGSADNKWSVTREGYYHIRVDVFRETIQAEYLGAAPAETTGTGLKELDNQTTGQFDNWTIGQSDNCESVKSSNCQIYDLSGRKLSGQSSMSNGQSSMLNGQSSMLNGQSSMFNGQWPKGIYIRDGKKVLIK